MTTGQLWPLCEQAFMGCKASARRHAGVALAGAAGTVAAVALVGVGLLARPERSVLYSSRALGNVQLGAAESPHWDHQDLIMKRIGELHKMPVWNSHGVASSCPEDTPGCALSHQADHRVVTRHHPLNYGYNYFTDEGSSKDEVTKDRMVEYTGHRHTGPRQVLFAGPGRDGAQRYVHKVGAIQADDVLDIPNDDGWQQGDVHVKVSERFPVSHIYKQVGRRPQMMLHRSSNKMRSQAEHKMREEARLRRGAPSPSFRDEQKKLRAQVHAAEHKWAPVKVRQLVVSGDSGKVLATAWGDRRADQGGDAAALPAFRRAARKLGKIYNGVSGKGASKDLNDYFDQLSRVDRAEHAKALWGRHSKRESDGRAA